jgi:hypothetical protein
MQESDAQLRIRLPRDIKDWLAEEAKKNLRTQSAEVTVLLREKMAAQEGAAQK